MSKEIKKRFTKDEEDSFTKGYYVVRAIRMESIKMESKEMLYDKIDELMEAENTSVHISFTGTKEIPEKFYYEDINE